MRSVRSRALAIPDQHTGPVRRRFSRVRLCQRFISQRLFYSKVFIFSRENSRSHRRDRAGTREAAATRTPCTGRPELGCPAGPSRPEPGACGGSEGPSQTPSPASADGADRELLTQRAPGPSGAAGGPWTPPTRADARRAAGRCRGSSAGSCSSPAASGRTSARPDAGNDSRGTMKHQRVDQRHQIN